MFIRRKDYKENLEQLKLLEKKNNHLNEDIKEWKSLVEISDDKIEKMENEIWNLKEKLHFSEEENKGYLKIIENIKNGVWVVLKNDEEQIVIQEEIKRIKEIYDEMQIITRDFEDLTGICTDDISDNLYDDYYNDIKNKELALQLGFKISDSLNVDRMLKEKEALDRFFEQKYKDYLDAHN